MYSHTLTYKHIGCTNTHFNTSIQKEVHVCTHNHIYTHADTHSCILKHTFAHQVTYAKSCRYLHRYVQIKNNQGNHDIILCEIQSDWWISSLTDWGIKETTSYQLEEWKRWNKKSRQYSRVIRETVNYLIYVYIIYILCICIYMLDIWRK